MIREAGASQTTEIVYSTEHEIGPLKDGLDWPVWTLNLVSALTRYRSFHSQDRMPPYQICDYKYRQGFGRRHESFDSEESEISSEDLSKETDRVSRKAPNLIINIPKAIPTRSSIWIWVFIGLLIQSVVFIINGLGVFYYHWPRTKYKVASYGFPIWAVGTILITIGSYICTKVIKTNTEECTARPRERAVDGQPAPHPKFHVVRLQKAIDSMDLPAFAIYNALDDPDVHISERGIFPSGRTENSRGHKTLAAWTVVGSFFALGGFILQNIGTRELHWSAAVAQLVATLILALIRAWVRRHVADAPVVAKKLSAGFEAAELACEIYHADRLMMYGGKICFDSIADEPPPKNKASKPHRIEEPYILD